MGVDLSEIIETSATTETDDPIHSHIVRTDAGESAEAKVLAARINGTALVALCGHVFTPQRDPEKYPLCSKCKEMFDFERQFPNG